MTDRGGHLPSSGGSTHFSFLREGHSLFILVAWFGCGLFFLEGWAFTLTFFMWVVLSLPADLMVGSFLFLLFEGALRLSSCNEGEASYFFLGLAVLPIFC